MRMRSPISCRRSLVPCLRSLTTHVRSCSTGRLPLCVTNTFTKEKEEVRIEGQQVFAGRTTGDCKRLTGLTYCCGPTVYADCHIGHAFNYVRFDLVRRMLSAYCNTDLITCMGVTDIDDKILEASRATGQDWRHLTDGFFLSFREDLSALNCLPPHVYARVTDHVSHIVRYVRRLEATGFAYVNEETGDVVFNSQAIPSFKSDLIHHDEEKSVGKRSPRDFSLWKKRKPDEPFYEYESSSTQSVIEGRPGWHVECSAIVAAVFNGVKEIDFHFGGKDLIFPHHYNESACCFAHSVGPKIAADAQVTSWCRHWLHSGHLVLNEEKMSKSLGNVISIKKFLSLHHPNIMRIICLKTGTRTDICFDDELLTTVTNIDLTIKRLCFLIEAGITKSGAGCPQDADQSLDDLVDHTEQEILTGVADDLTFSTGLYALLDLYDVLKDRSNLSFTTLAKAQLVLSRWFAATGLVYSIGGGSKDAAVQMVQLLEQVACMRATIRETGIQLLKTKDTRGRQLLQVSDDLRTMLEERGVLVADPSSKLS